MRDSGVSAVVGVMLMLSLVIIIAAVLSAFASGIAQTPAASPSAEIAAYTAGEGENFRLVFDHRGGDRLNPNDCKITVFVRDHESSFSAADLTDESVWNAASGVLTTHNQSYTAELFGISESELETYAAAATPVELRIYHLPTNSILMKTTILLENKP